jgi:hypothetical protein
MPALHEQACDAHRHLTDTQTAKNPSPLAKDTSATGIRRNLKSAIPAKVNFYTGIRFSNWDKLKFMIVPV